MLNRDEDILKAAEDWQKAGHGVALPIDLLIDDGAVLAQFPARGRDHKVARVVHSQPLGALGAQADAAGVGAAREQ